MLIQIIANKYNIITEKTETLISMVSSDDVHGQNENHIVNIEEDDCSVTPTVNMTNSMLRQNDNNIIINTALRPVAKYRVHMEAWLKMDSFTLTKVKIVHKIHDYKKNTWLYKVQHKSNSTIQHVTQSQLFM